MYIYSWKEIDKILTHFGDVLCEKYFFVIAHGVRLDNRVKPPRESKPNWKKYHCFKQLEVFLESRFWSCFSDEQHLLLRKCSLQAICQMYSNAHAQKTNKQTKNNPNRNNVTYDGPTTCTRRKIVHYNRPLRLGLATHARKMHKISIWSSIGVF